MADKHGRVLVVVKVRTENINTAHLETETERQTEIGTERER